MIGYTFLRTAPRLRFLFLFLFLFPLPTPVLSSSPPSPSSSSFPPTHPSSLMYLSIYTHATKHARIHPFTHPPTHPPLPPPLHFHLHTEAYNSLTVPFLPTHPPTPPIQQLIQPTAFSSTQPNPPTHPPTHSSPRRRHTPSNRGSKSHPLVLSIYLQVPVGWVDGWVDEGEKKAV